MIEGWLVLVTVTLNIENGKLTLEACKETLHALFKGNPITHDDLESLSLFSILFSLLCLLLQLLLHMLTTKYNQEMKMLHCICLNIQR